MPSNRIILGVDPHSDLAVSLEGAPSGYFCLTVSTSDLRTPLCRFVCSEHELARISDGASLMLSERGHDCSISSAGEQILFEIKRGDEESAICALSANSFNRVLRLAKSRVFLS